MHSITSSLVVLAVLIPLAACAAPTQPADVQVDVDTGVKVTATSPPRDAADTDLKVTTALSRVEGTAGPDIGLDALPLGDASCSVLSQPIYRYTYLVTNHGTAPGTAHLSAWRQNVGDDPNDINDILDSKYEVVTLQPGEQKLVNADFLDPWWTTSPKAAYRIYVSSVTPDDWNPTNDNLEDNSGSYDSAGNPGEVWDSVCRDDLSANVTKFAVAP